MPGDKNRGSQQREDTEDTQVPPDELPPIKEFPAPSQDSTASTEWAQRGLGTLEDLLGAKEANAYAARNSYTESARTATPGGWHIDAPANPEREYRAENACRYVETNDQGHHVATTMDTQEADGIHTALDNAAFIAFSREAAPHVLALVEAAREWKASGFSGKEEWQALAAELAWWTDE